MQSKINGLQVNKSNIESHNLATKDCFQTTFNLIPEKTVISQIAKWKLPYKLFAKYILVILLIIGLLQITFAQNGGVGTTSAGNAPGSPVGSYQLTGIDNINYYNGSLNFTLPITSIGGRGEAGTASIFRINRIWSVQTYYGGLVGGYQHSPNPNTYSNVPKYGPGYVEEQMGGEVYIPCELEGPPTGGFARTRNNIVFTDANGNRYELRDTIYDGKPIQTPGGEICYPNVQGVSRGKIFVAKDGSGITYISDTDIKENSLLTIVNTISGYILMPNGTKYRIEHGMVKWIKDRNGNQTSFTYVNESPGNNPRQLATITDSLNRVTTFQYEVNEPAPYGLSDKITFKGTNGQDRVIRISYKSLGQSLRSDINPQTNPINFGPYQLIDMNIFLNTNVVSAFWLPDGRNYQFKYNQYGELARVELPIGGAYEYDYAAGTADEGRNGFSDFTSFATIYRRATQKRVYKENGILENKILIDRRPTNGNFTVTTVDQNNVALTLSKHYYYGNAEESLMWSYASPMEYSQWKEGKEYKTETLDPNTQAVLRKTETTWAQQANVSWWTGNQDQAPENNPRVTETKSTLETGQVSSQIFSYDQYNNLTDTYEYDFGQGSPGAFLRRSHTDYVTDTNYTAHTAAHIRNLVSQTWVSSDLSGSSITARTQFEYDNYVNDSTHAPLLSRSSVSGHDSMNYHAGNPWRGNVTKTTSYGNANNMTEPVTNYIQYDILGNPIKTIDANGNVSTFSYNDNFGAPNGEARTNSDLGQLNGLQTFTFATSSTNPKGWITYAQFDYFTGGVVDAEDINGNVSSNFYNDPLDRPTQTIVANNTGLRSQSTIVYDDTNHRTQTTADLFIFGDNLSKSENFYDGLGRTLQTRKYEENGGYVAILTEYDALGRVKRVTNPYRPAQNEPQLWITTNYDALSRPINVTTPDGSVASTIYSGNITIVTDQAGKQTRSIANVLGQLVRVDESNDNGNLGTVATPIQPTNYQYNTNGQMVRVTQGEQSRFFLYDSLGKLLRVRQPEQIPNNNLNFTDGVTGNNQWTAGFTYDNNGNLLTALDAKGVLITNTYDNINRPLTKTYSDGTPTVTYSYDSLVLQYSKGRLTQVSNAVSTSQVLAFDKLGRILASRQITDDDSYDSSYLYNLSGGLVEETYPSGRKIRNTFEIDGDLSKIETQQVGGTYQIRAQNLSYSSSGILEKLQLGNGLWKTAQLNSRFQVIQLGLGTSSTDTSFWKLNYDYGTTNNDGNIKAQTLTTPTAVYSQIFQYDSLDRLKQAVETVGGNQTWIQNFTYDRYGNRIGFNQTLNGQTTSGTPSVDVNTNRFNTGQGYTYDFVGNVMQDPQGKQYLFNGDNKQVEVKDSNNNLIGQYFYDGDGKRIKKVTNTETTTFVYSGSKLVAEYTVTNATPTTPTTQYVATDIIGSPRIITDQNAQVVSRRDFLPFGEEIPNFGTRTQAGGYKADNIRQKFTSYQKDNETGLDFAETRYYNNSVGRFTAVDPLLASGRSANPQTFNRYAYVGNNPIVRTDPNGLDWYQNKDGVIQYFEGSGKRKGWKNITGTIQMVESVGSAFKAAGAKKGDAVFFTNSTIEVISSHQSGFVNHDLIKSLARNGTQKFAVAALVVGGGGVIFGTGGGLLIYYGPYAGGTALINLGIAGQRSPDALQRLLQWEKAVTPAGRMIDVGGKGEITNAININISKLQNVENVIQGNASNIEKLIKGSEFAGEKIGMIRSSNFTNIDMNWSQFAEGSFKLLENGGKITLQLHGAGSVEAVKTQILPALQRAGFTQLSVYNGNMVHGIKPY